MPFVIVNKLKIYYEVHGKGPRLLYIGGTGGDLRRSPTVFDAPLTDHFEVLSLDQRGMGQTEKPDEPYTMATYAADVKALLDSLGWGSCMLMGYSFGGMVAQEVALNEPQRFTRLVLSATSSGGDGGASFPLHTISQLSLRERATMMVHLSDVRRGDEWIKQNPRMHEIMVEQTMAILNFSEDQEGFERGANHQLEARKHHNTYARLPQLPMPTLVVGGNHDEIAPASSVTALAERVPGAQLQFFDGGHMFHLQDPSAWPAIITFLKKQS